MYGMALTTAAGRSTLFLKKTVSDVVVVGRRYYPKKWKRAPNHGIYKCFLNEEVTKDILETVAAPLPVLKEPPKPRRTYETNPANHSFEDVGKFYVIPENDMITLFSIGGFPNKHTEAMKMFAENSMMIRKPAVEIMDYMKMADYSKPAIRYLIYGMIQTGKSLCLNHIIHYAHLQDFLIFHVPYVPYWLKWNRGVANASEVTPGMHDLPLVGASLLTNFQLQNARLLKELNLRTTEEYAWNERESCPVDTPLEEMVAFGVSRSKYSCIVVRHLISELKKASTAGRLKLLIAIDGYNSLYSRKTMLKGGAVIGKVKTENITLVETMKLAVQNDFSNGAIVMVVGQKSTTPDKRDTFTPLYLLEREGFENIDPCIPIHVPRLTEDEFHWLLDYYEDRRYLIDEGGRADIEFITTRVAGEVYDYCAPL